MITHWNLCFILQTYPRIMKLLTLRESLVGQSLNFSRRIITLSKQRTLMFLSLSCHSSLYSACWFFRKYQQPEGSSMCNRKKPFDRFFILILNENNIRENSWDMNLKELCPKDKTCPEISETLELSQTSPISIKKGPTALRDCQQQFVKL